MTIQQRKVILRFSTIAASTTAVCTIIGFAYGFHSWHREKMSYYVIEKINHSLLPIEVKLDVMMNPEQKREAAEILKIKRYEKE